MYTSVCIQCMYIPTDGRCGAAGSWSAIGPSFEAFAQQFLCPAKPRHRTVARANYWRGGRIWEVLGYGCEDGYSAAAIHQDAFGPTHCVGSSE